MPGNTQAPMSDDQILVAHDFDPTKMSDDEKKQALEVIADEERAERDKQEAESKKDGKGFRYFRNKENVGEDIIVGPPLPGNVAPQTERFRPYYEKWRGDTIRVGYLKTNNPEVIARLESLSHVEEINAKEYKESTSKKKGARVAPY